MYASSWLIAGDCTYNITNGTIREQVRLSWFSHIITYFFIPFLYEYQGGYCTVQVPPTLQPVITILVCKL